MTGGPLGAAACLAAGTLAGLCALRHARGRQTALEEWLDALEATRLMLEEERLPLGELLAAAAGGGETGETLRRMARLLRERPSLTLEGAWREARDARVPPEARAALDALMPLLGGGSAARRALAVEACLRRLRPLAEKARERADRAGGLYARLGLLGGLAAGVALW